MAGQKSISSPVDFGVSANESTHIFLRWPLKNRSQVFNRDGDAIRFAVAISQITKGAKTYVETCTRAGARRSVGDI